MSAALKNLLPALLPILLGSGGANQRATSIVRQGRAIYIGSAAWILLAWYSAWRNERVDPEIKGKFPFPGLTNLKPKFSPDREDEEEDQGYSGPTTTSKQSTPTEGTGDTAGPGVLGIAPPGLKKAIAWAQKVSGKYPYIWGGGHSQIGVPNGGGFDCSGAVSGVLGAAGLLSTPLVSGGLAVWGDPGEGRYITIYANDDHTFMKINVNGTWRWFGTGSGKLAIRGGVAWGNHDDDLSAYAVRHPRGY